MAPVYFRSNGANNFLNNVVHTKLRREFLCMKNVKLNFGQSWSHPVPVAELSFTHLPFIVVHYQFHKTNTTSWCKQCTGGLENADIEHTSLCNCSHRAYIPVQLQPYRIHPCATSGSSTHCHVYAEVTVETYDPNDAISSWSVISVLPSIELRCAWYL
jgi:hypothetical protein